nr:glycosyltransferase [Neobacillus sp. Marseille-Q6967]
MDFSVLISVYHKENPDFLNASINSVITQTLKPKEIVIVKDGPLTKELDHVIADFTNSYPHLFKLIPLEKNRGLGTALQIGVENCSHDLIARMDSDDISHPKRFEKQIPYMYSNPEIDVLGSWILEFDDHSNREEQYIRKVPLQTKDIVLYSKKRNPLNHMTVVFRKTTVLKAGNYQPLLWNEDYYLWGRIISQGSKIQNLEDILVYVRAGDELFRRRGGLNYIKNEFILQREFLKMNFISPMQFCFNMVRRAIVRVTPTFIRKIIYRKFLRDSIL